MNRRYFNQVVLGGVTATLAARSFSQDSQLDRYDTGSVISPDVTVFDLRGAPQTLDSLWSSGDADISVIFIFGGGALGVEGVPSGIWCGDSYEDLHILRALVGKYKSEPVNFIPIACPPVFATARYGFADRAFFDYAEDSPVYQDILEKFIDSTQAAVDNGTIPLQPYYDPKFRLLMDMAGQSLSAEYGAVPAWQGQFRAVDESQTYGVPAFWLVNRQGVVLDKPYRGNIYYTHHGSMNINYTLVDLVSAIDEQLAAT